ncbi:MAG TPA: substrate-binding domain-containing protein [Acidimicrobiales bacterium]|nr:substrate-binding domain-containing protein [Acidimicrobiales bacterium]
MNSAIRRLCTASVGVVAVAGLLAGCGSNNNNSSKSSTSTTAKKVSVSATSFTPDFSVMKQLTSLAAQGSGKIGVLLPDTASSARYVAFDAPLLERAFKAAGLTSADFKIDNAQGSAVTQQQQAEADITEGATVLLLDQLDSGSAAAIETNAQAHGVKVIDYDRLTKGGVDGRYYVSFDNVTVGKLIGQGLVDCISSWNVAQPQVLELDGDPTDNNATLFAQGYNSVLQPKFDSGTYVKVAEPGGTWNNQTALTLFEQQYTAHANINAVVAANDGLGNAVISALKTRNVPAKKIPVTGQDATAQGIQNVLADYQCGSVYKPIQVEAQAAAAMALYLRAGQTPPKALVNGTTHDPTANKDVPSVLLTPVWVTKANIKATVIKDAFLKASEICTTDTATACKDAGIS